MEDYDKIKKTLAVAFMHNLDANRPEGKMCLSNGECADIDKAFNEQDWPKLAKYLDKYTESEDERIRKEIIDFLETIPASELKRIPRPISEWFSWLEKQKEPKHAPDDFQKSFEAGQRSIVDNPEQYGLCKKTEWSSEDEFRLKEALEVLDESIRHLPIGCGYLTDVMNVTKWLKSLRPQPKQEWSEDDKRILYNVIAYVGYAAGERGVKDDDFKEANEWLKNLRYHTSWKPSEEQMKALKQVVFYGDPLRTLYEQLKEL